MFDALDRGKTHRRGSKPRALAYGQMVIEGRPEKAHPSPLSSARMQFSRCAASTSLYNARMAVSINSYFVRLRPDLSPQAASEFRAFVKKTPSGKPPSDTRLILPCVRVDLLHHFYAKLTINVEDGAPPMDLWVPHEMILMIGDIGHVGRTPVAFTSTE
jgi:hypothetical protein